MAKAGDLLRKQADLLDLEHELSESKKSKTGPSRELKMKVRKARQAAREERERQA